VFLKGNLSSNLNLGVSEANAESGKRKHCISLGD
jgi:hypothetical protein